MKLLLIPIISLLFLSCTTPTKKEKSPKHLANLATAANQKGFDAELTQYKYPFDVKFFKIKTQSQDLKMAYMDIASGKPSDKVVVLLHGKNFPGAYFEELILALNQRNYRVIVPDQIGFGKSSKPKNYQFSFHDLARNTKALMDSLGVQRYQLLGHSMGGMLATRFALMYPSSVTKLYLVNPIGLEDWKTMTSYRDLDQTYAAELATNLEKVKNYQLEFYYDGKWKAEYDKWLDIPKGWLEGPDYQSVAWNAALTADMIFTQPVFYEFKNLKMKTILIIGDKDKTAIGKAWALPENKVRMGDYPKMSQTVKQMIPDSQLILLKGMGHIPFVENFERFWASFAKTL